MQKADIKKDYLNKIKRFKDNSKYYYEKSKPKITDADFDQLKAEILELEKKYNFLKDINSPSNVIGFRPSKNFKKIKHQVPMLSLGNAFNEEDLRSFEKKVINFCYQIT